MHPKSHMKMIQIGRKRGLLRAAIYEEQNMLESNDWQYTTISVNLPPCTALVHIN